MVNALIAVFLVVVEFISRTILKRRGEPLHSRYLRFWGIELGGSGEKSASAGRRNQAPARHGPLLEGCCPVSVGGTMSVGQSSHNHSYQLQARSSSSATSVCSLYACSCSAAWQLWLLMRPTSVRTGEDTRCRRHTCQHPCDWLVEKTPLLLYVAYSQPTTTCYCFLCTCIARLYPLFVSH